MTDWLTDWLAGWLAGRLAGWLTGCPTGGLTDWPLACWVAYHLAGWLTDWSTHWVTNWLADCLTCVIGWFDDEFTCDNAISDQQQVISTSVWRRVAERGMMTKICPSVSLHLMTRMTNHWPGPALDLPPRHSRWHPPKNHRDKTRTENQ